MNMESQVFSIREAATLNLQKLAAEFGPDWAKEHLVPQARIPAFQGTRAGARLAGPSTDEWGLLALCWFGQC